MDLWKLCLSARYYSEQIKNYYDIRKKDQRITEMERTESHIVHLLSEMQDYPSTALPCPLLSSLG